MPVPLIDLNKPETFGHRDIIMYLSGLKGRPGMEADAPFLKRAITLLAEAAPKDDDE